MNFPPSSHRNLYVVLTLGLLEFKTNPPLAATASRAKGFDFGIVAILEKAEDLEVYAPHPAHQEYGFLFLSRSRIEFF